MAKKQHSARGRVGRRRPGPRRRGAMPDCNEHAAIWDVDGTLVDTAELHFEAWATVARGLGRPFTRADFARTFGLRNPEIIHQLFGTDPSDEHFPDLGDHK